MIPGFATIAADTLIGWTRALTALPSEQTALLERDPAVLGFIAEGVAPLLRAQGLAPRLDAMGNLLVEAGPAEAGLSLVFFAYAMTHPRAAMAHPFDAALLGEGEAACIRGRGVSEQKAALTASLAAFLDLAAAGGLRRRIAWLLLTAGETGRHDAIAAALAALGEMPSHGIVAIGTDGRISLGNRGRLDLQMTIEGQACHSSTPWLGIDATRGVRLALEQAEAIGATLGRDPVLGPATLTCTAIRTFPEATHTLQSRAELTFDRRLLPGEDPEAVLAGLRESFALPPPLAMSLARGPFMHGCRIEADAPFVRLVRQSVAACGLPAPAIFHSDGALDAGYLAQQGIEAVMWGPGDPAQFHTGEERVAVRDLVAMARAYRAVAASLAQ